MTRISGVRALKKVGFLNNRNFQKIHIKFRIPVILIQKIWPLLIIAVIASIRVTIAPIFQIVKFKIKVGSIIQEEAILQEIQALLDQGVVLKFSTKVVKAVEYSKKTSQV